MKNNRNYSRFNQQVFFDTDTEGDFRGGSLYDNALDRFHKTLPRDPGVQRLSLQDTRCINILVGIENKQLIQGRRPPSSYALNPSTTPTEQSRSTFASFMENFVAMKISKFLNWFWTWKIPFYLVRSSQFRRGLDTLGKHFESNCYREHSTLKKIYVFYLGSLAALPSRLRKRQCEKRSWAK